MNKICYKCKAALDEGDIFCSKCGARVQRKCEQCGNSLSDDDVFCSKCGASLSYLQNVPEGIVISAAKAVAHRLNNALSIVLTDSQLALRETTDLPGEAGGEIQSYLRDIAAAAKNSGAVIHQFQKFLDHFTNESLQRESSAYVDFLSFVESGQQKNGARDIERPLLKGIEDIGKKTVGRQIPVSPRPRVLDANLRGKRVSTAPERVRNISILIVDDEDKIRHALSYALTLGGHHVITASDGQEALKLFKNGSYDVVFIDLKMPGMDGWSVANAIRLLNSGTKLVLMTGLRVELSDERLKESHVDAVIAKPFELSEIGNLIAAVIDDEC